MARAFLKPEKLPKKWRELLCLVPGYDPIATAEDCSFDFNGAELALNFFPECLKHVEGELAGKPFILSGWEQCFIANLFGWKRQDNLERWARRYRETLLYVPRKNGKTPLGAGISLYVLFCDEESGQQNYIAAADREQAGMLFRHAKGMVDQEPALQRRCRIYGGNASAGQSRSIVIEQESSFLRIISADANTKHGGNSHLVIVDELHAQPNRDLIDVLQTSTASLNRKNPLTIFISTADFNRPSICNEKHDYACKVRDGIIKDLSFLPFIYEAKPEEDWTDPAIWKKVNPNLGVSVSLEYLERECKRAQETPAYENTFKRLHANMKTEQDVRAIPMSFWDSCGGGVEPVEWRRRKIAELRGRQCLGGLDLGSTSDITALALIFGETAPFTFLPYFWVPLDSASKREKRDKVPYETWIKQGFITGTSGNVTDYAQVRKELNELADWFSIIELAVDRLFQGAQLCIELEQDAFQVIAYGQGFYQMAAPAKRFLELILEGGVDHGNNPVLRWMASNASTESDAAGNIKFSKKKSSEKIDGIVACTMVLGRRMVQVSHPYGDRGMLVL